MSTSPAGPQASDSPLIERRPGDLGWHLATILRQHQVALTRCVGQLPGAVRGYQLLATVVHRDLANQQELGAHLGIDRTVLTYLLDELVEAHLVERVATPNDRRARKVIATKTGQRLLISLELKVAQAEQELLSGLAAEEKAQFADLIEALSRSVRGHNLALDPCVAVEELG